MKTLHNALALIRELKTDEIEIISGGTYEGSGVDGKVVLTMCCQSITTPQGPSTINVPDDAHMIVYAD